MDWQRYFKRRELDLGRIYHMTNRVRNLSFDAEGFHAQVFGRELQSVVVRMMNGQMASMGCTCRDAKEGKACEHMAALMFAVEKEGAPLQRAYDQQFEKQVHPFESDSSDTFYQYYDMVRMARDLKFYEQDYEEAKQLLESKKITLKRVEIFYKYGVASGIYDDGTFERKIELTFNREQISKADCSVYGCGGGFDYQFYFGTKRVCSHILALMMLLDEYLKKYHPGDSTDREGVKMFRQFRQNQKRETLKQQEQKDDLILEPVFEKNGNEVSLSFKCGADKIYVVKNLREFVHLYEEQDKITFGTKTHVDFAKHRLNEKSKPFYKFLQQLIKADEARLSYERGRSRYYYEEENLKNRIPLYDDRIDRVFELLEGKTVAFTEKGIGKNKKSTILFSTGEPKIDIRVDKDIDGEGIFHGIKVSGTLPEIIQGRDYFYYFTENAFCRMSEDMAQAVSPIVHLAENRNFSFTVGRNHLAEFYHEVLPVLGRYTSVQETESDVIRPYVPPKASFVFFLDAENKNAMCKPVVRYGEKEFPLADHWRDDVSFDIVRNRNQERTILEQLQEWFPEVDKEQEELHCGESEELILQLMDGGVERLMALGEVHTTERFRHINSRKKLKLTVGVSVENNLMNLTISDSDIDREELLEILRSYRRKKKYYRLKNGEFISVNETDIEMLTELMETLRISPKEFVKGKMQVPVYRALYLSKMLEQGEEVYLNRDKHFKKLIKEFKTVEDSEFDVPEQFKPVMRKYQVQGFRWLKTLEQYGFGGILADDMGLGKTLQMISVLQSAKEQGTLQTALIVSPASLVYNWKEEFRRFAPDLKVTAVVGTAKERAEIIRGAAESDVLVTSYDLIKRDIAEYEDITFSHQVLDEAQYIKNHSTAAAKTVKVVKSKHRFALTGTPIENRLSELWSIFDYLMPGYLYGYETFRKELETPIVKYHEESASERLKKMIGPFVLRRLKKDVLKDLPDKLEEIRYARLENEQKTIYDAQVVHMQQMIENQNPGDFQKNKLQILAELTKIRQICCDPSLLFEQYRGESAKRTACMELIRSAIEGEHKILVFSQFTSMLELLEKDLRTENIPYYKITGATSKELRLELVYAFNSDHTPVFLISLKAGGTGLNLTGADVVVHYDPWWNQAAQNQATDRAHRIGQEKVVTVYKLIVKDTIEEKIVEMQESKRDLADQVLSGENGGLSQMSKEELMELLG